MFEVSTGNARVTIPGVADFEVSADPADVAELVGEWRDLLRSHLSAYICVGRDLPEPEQTSWLRVAEPLQTTTVTSMLWASLGANLGGVQEPTAPVADNPELAAA
jgi:hypothetical protein